MSVLCFDRQQAINGARGAPGATSEYIGQLDLWTGAQGARALLEATAIGKVSASVKKSRSSTQHQRGEPYGVTVHRKRGVLVIHSR
jgi:hypothetical protein